MEMNKSFAALTPAATLGQITSIDRQAGQLLASIGLHASEHEDKTLQSVCKQKQWSEVEVLRWIKKNCRLRDGQADGAEPSDRGQSDTPDFGEDLSSWWIDLTLTDECRCKLAFQRIALMGHPSWKVWMQTFISPLLAGEIQFFAGEDISRAQSWLGSSNETKKVL